MAAAGKFDNGTVIVILPVKYHCIKTAGETTIAEIRFMPA
jgi:hypothetical protein